MRMDKRSRANISNGNKPIIRSIIALVGTNVTLALDNKIPIIDGIIQIGSKI